MALLAMSSQQLKNQPSYLSGDCPIKIKLDNVDLRKHIAIHKKNGNTNFVPVYTTFDTFISGKIETQSEIDIFKYPYTIKVQFIGKIDLFKGPKKSFEFISMSQTVIKPTKPGCMASFKFDNIPRKYETYTGDTAQISYHIKAVLCDHKGTKVYHEQEIALQLPSRSPINAVNLYNIQIGVVNAVEVDLQYKKLDYHLQDCVTGKLSVHIAQVEIRRIEFYLIKMEYCLTTKKPKIKEEVIQKITVKEDQPKKGDIIPLKMYLGDLNLSPTMQSVENKFSVRYFLTLGLIDGNDRMFFRRVEITLRRGMDE